MDLSLLKECRVLPVVTPLDENSTVELAGALQRGGMKAIEITLRSAAAMDSIRAVQERVPEILVAAGTVITPQDLEAVQEAGVKLALSPGATPELLAAAAASRLPFIPGIASASELMQGLAHGFDMFKLFPAEALGGRAMLKSLGGPFPQVRFCPTGGLNPANFRDYLALDNVVCCGGSWMVTEALVAAGRWDEIEVLAREAMAD
ncbi:MAG: bifunctional 4-hydroxy-2-oxoglutarate aldolase/2-dehydro-3-deoxy-phosphogluconate aldolase [Haliea sp.]|jgi:2-dehydro-3-deoxyphosphogluconate aldolase/(4S)-4-hydroxy-2-oxoglutarate aldolase|nr:bifunctional 4-hydroxy-2-oxoglutarate aldolase/2-dehydro-3-deoxy-phosphogluconate aldolase [Haliea sp.]